MEVRKNSNVYFFSKLRGVGVHRKFLSKHSSILLKMSKVLNKNRKGVWICLVGIYILLNISYNLAKSTKRNMVFYYFLVHSFISAKKKYDCKLFKSIHNLINEIKFDVILYSLKFII